MDFILKIPGYVEDIILSSWTETFLQILLRAFFFVLDILQDFSLTVLTGSMQISLKLTGVALLEVSFQLIITYVNTWEDKHPTDDLPIEKEDVSKSVASQTCGPWQKKIRSKERVYSELLVFFANKTSILKRRRQILLRKGKLKVNHLTKEYAGKKKLLSGVCHRLVNTGVEIDHLSHRIREKRHLLDNRRLQNREVIKRYEELNQQLNSYLNNVLHTQQQVPVEEVQPEIPAV